MKIGRRVGRSSVPDRTGYSGRHSKPETWWLESHQARERLFDGIRELLMVVDDMTEHQHAAGQKAEDAFRTLLSAQAISDAALKERSSS